MVLMKRWPAIAFLAVVVFALSGVADQPALLASPKTIRIRMNVPPEAFERTRQSRCSSDVNCHNRWHWAIKPVAMANPGDTVVFETRDALDGAFGRNSRPADVAAANLNLVHPITGPLFVSGAEVGDALAVTLIDIEPAPFGYTIIVPGFGFLRDIFPDPFIVRWNLNRSAATSPDMPGVRIPYAAFIGTIGVAPGPKQVEAWFQREDALRRVKGFVLPPEPRDALPRAVCGSQGTNKDRCLRTIPPRENGGNMDIKGMQRGTTLFLPCFAKGCLLSVGDVHYAQGDGEVAGTAIEMNARVTVRVDVRKGWGTVLKRPHFRGGSQLKTIAPKRFHATVGYPLKGRGKVPAIHAYLDGTRIGPLENLSEDVSLAARDALIEMIDWITRNRKLSAQQAYVLASVAVDLRIGNLVDVPNFAVYAVLPLEVFR